MATWPALRMLGIELRRADEYGPLEGHEIVPVYSRYGTGRQRDGSILLSELLGGGGGGVGDIFTSIFEGAQPRPLGERLSQQIYLLDFIPHEHPTSGNDLHAAIRDGKTIHEKIINAEGILVDNPDFYDCYDAFQAAIATIDVRAQNIAYVPPAPIPTFSFGPEILFPYGHCYFGRTLEINKTVILTGYTTGDRSTIGTELWFKAGITGIVMNYIGTFEGGRVENDAMPMGGGTIRHLSIRSFSNGNHETDPDLRWDKFNATEHWKGHGIWCRTRTNIQHCRIVRFPNHGLYVYAAAVVGDSPGGDSARGNANLMWVSHVSSLTNGGCGIYIDGPDTNAGVFQNCDLGSNFGTGIYDSSFLGNTHIGHHAANNGRDAMCSYQLEPGVSQNRLYYLKDEARAAGDARSWLPDRQAPQDSYCKNHGNLYRQTAPVGAAPRTAKAPATGPSGTGTNIVDGTARWTYVQPVGMQIPPLGHPDSALVWDHLGLNVATTLPFADPVWPPFPYDMVPGGSTTPALRTRWARGHSFWFDSQNAHNAICIGLYAEGGQPPAYINPTVSVIATNFAFSQEATGRPPGFGSGGSVRTGFDFFSKPGSDHQYEVRINQQADEALGFSAEYDTSTAGLGFIFNEPDRTWAWQHARVPQGTAQRFTTGISTLQGGRTEPIPAGRSVFAGGIWLGGAIGSEREITTGTGPPTTGAYASGDFMFRSEITNVGNVLGWRCIADGTPGTWQPIHVNQASQRVGDAALVLTPVQSPYASVFTVPIIAGGRTVSLSAVGAVEGLRYRITRTTASTGGLITVGFADTSIPWEPNTAYAFGIVRSNDGNNYTAVSVPSGVSAPSVAPKPVVPMPAWAPDTYYNLNVQRQHGGNVYKTVEAGISANNPAWTPGTAYSVNALTVGQPGQVINDGGRIYRCVKDGVSSSAVGATGPTGTVALSPYITDGTTAWAFVHPKWLSRTFHALGKIVNNDDGKLYRCIQAGVTGAAAEWGKNRFYKEDAVVENDINKVYVCRESGYSADPYPQWKPNTLYIVGEGVVNADGRGAFRYNVLNPPLAIAAALQRYYVCTQAGRSATYGIWKASTAYVAGTTVSNGNDMYECRVGGTSAASGGPTGETPGVDISDGTVLWRYTRIAGPDGKAAEIIDGTCKWKFQSEEGPTGTGTDIRDGPKHTVPGSGIYLAGSGCVWDYAYPPWAPSTAYEVGQLVNNDNGKQYRCVDAGTSNSAGPGPVGKLLSITDNTVGWTYFPNPDWIPNYDYTEGMLVNSDDLKIYKCSTAGRSHDPTTSPPWVADTVYTVGQLRINDVNNKLYKCTKVTGDAKSATTTAWQPSHVYAVGQTVRNGQASPTGVTTLWNVYVVFAVTGNAMSAGTGLGPNRPPPLNVTSDPNIIDGNVTWRYKSRADGPKGTGQVSNMFGPILDNNVSWTFISGAFGPLGTDENPLIRDGDVNTNPLNTITWDWLAAMPDSLGPAGTGTKIDDGTARWEYVSTGGGGPTTGPTGTSSYIVDGGCAWRFISSLAAMATNGPTGTGNAIVDGTVTWAYQPSPITTLTTGQWCDVAWSGTEWYLEAKGSLA